MAIRVSQEILEALLVPNTRNARVSQIPLEILLNYNTYSTARVSQLPLEVLTQYFAPPVTSTKIFPAVQCI